MTKKIGCPLDEEFIGQFLAGSHEAFRELYYRYYAMVRRICSNIIENEAVAEELTQDTFLKVLCELHNFRSGNFSGWLKSVARNLALNKRIRKTIEKKALNSLINSDVIQSSRTRDPAKNSEDKELKRFLSQALEELPELTRKCVVAFYTGYTYAEIAKMYYLTVGQVESHLRKGRLYVENKLKRLR